MQVDFHATLRDVAGCKRVRFDLPGGSSVRHLLEAVFGRFPVMRLRLVDASGALHPHVHVFVNGRDARYLNGGLDAPVDADAKVDVFPAVGGG